MTNITPSNSTHSTSAHSTPEKMPQAMPKTTIAHFHCFNCGSDQYDHLFDAYDFDTGKICYPIVRCKACGLNYTANITEEALSDAYSQSYYGSGKKKFLSIVELIVQQGHQRQAQKILGTYFSLQNSDAASDSKLKVLDIGCGRGLLTRAFSKLGHECLGIEREEFQALPTDAFDSVDIHFGSLSDKELDGRKFDIIVIWHVLEHISELRELFDQLPQHISEGGILVISVPNFSSWQSRCFKKHWFHLDLPRHVAHFDQEFLFRKLSKLNLEVVKWDTFIATQNTYGFLQSILNKFFPRKANRLYRLLTRGKERKNIFYLIGWISLATILLPIALLELAVSSIAKRGATLTVYAKHNKEP